MKWRQMVAALIGICLFTVPATAAGSVQVEVFGAPVAWEDATPFVENGRTMVPLRAAGEAMGLTVEWDGTTRCASFSAEFAPEQAWLDGIASDETQEYLTGITVRMYAGQSEYEVVDTWTSYDDAGQVTGQVEEVIPMEMDTAAVIRDNRTYAPIRYVAEAFGNEVIWEAESRTVRIVAGENATWMDQAYLTEDNGQTALLLVFRDLQNIETMELLGVTIDDQAVSFAQADMASLAELELPADAIAYTVVCDLQEGTDYRLRYAVQLVKTNGVQMESVAEMKITLPSA